MVHTSFYGIKPLIKACSLFSGNDVVIVKNGRRICGTGAALANAPIAQNKAYFEVKVQCTGLLKFSLDISLSLSLSLSFSLSLSELPALGCQ